MSLKAYRPVTLTPKTVPDDFLALSVLNWPRSQSGTVSTIPAFQFGQHRSLNYVDIGTGLTKWARINPSAGVYDWSGMDAMVIAHDAAGRTVSYTMHGNPAWCRKLGTYSENAGVSSYVDYGEGSAGPIDSAFLPQISDFVQRLINRYNFAAGGVFATDKLRISSIQAINEPRYWDDLYVTLDAGYTGSPTGWITDVTTGNTGYANGLTLPARALRLLNCTGKFTKGGQITGAGFSAVISTNFKGVYTPFAGTHADIAAYVRQCRLGIDASDARVKLISPGFGYPVLSQAHMATSLNTLDADGVAMKDRVDYIGYQPYNYYSSSVRAHDSSLNIEKLITDFEAITSKPCCYTEFGVSQPVAGDEDGLLTLRAMVIAVARGAAMINVYSWDAGFFPRSASSDARVASMSALAGKTIEWVREDVSTRELNVKLSTGEIIIF